MESREEGKGVWGRVREVISIDFSGVPRLMEKVAWFVVSKKIALGRMREAVNSVEAKGFDFLGEKHGEHTVFQHLKCEADSIVGACRGMLFISCV